jgi:hypothetical protein
VSGKLPFDRNLDAVLAGAVIPKLETRILNPLSTQNLPKSSLMYEL